MKAFDLVTEGTEFEPEVTEESGFWLPSFALGLIPRGLLRLGGDEAGEKYSGERLRPAGCPRRPAEDFGGFGGKPRRAPETGAPPPFPL